MRKIFFRQNGQMANEHAIMIALVIAALMAMTIVLKRALQGRLHDAKSTMMDIVKDASVEANAVGRLYGEYEPYYAATNSDIERSIQQNKILLPGGSTGISRKSQDDTTSVNTVSVQLPPGEGG
ncbi:MAG: hypothetical protein WC676_01475 [Candidatus Omnitrophota bacterium]